MEKYPNQKLEGKWVHQPITQEIVSWCESFGKYLATKKTTNAQGRTYTTTKAMTTSQLRRFFGEVKRIEMQEEYNASEVAMLNPLLAYAVGRDSDETKIGDFQREMSKAISEIKNKEDFKNFVNIFESIVAYHKYHGGK